MEIVVLVLITSRYGEAAQVRRSTRFVSRQRRAQGASPSADGQISNMVQPLEYGSHDLQYVLVQSFFPGFQKAIDIYLNKQWPADGMPKRGPHPSFPVVYRHDSPES